MKDAPLLERTETEYAPSFFLLRVSARGHPLCVVGAAHDAQAPSDLRALKLFRSHFWLGAIRLEEPDADSHAQLIREIAQAWRIAFARQRTRSPYITACRHGSTVPPKLLES